MLTDVEIMAQVLAAFQEEQAEHRQAIGDLLLTLERGPEPDQRRPLLDQLFREAHSLKGGARAAGQPVVEQLAHRIEDLFSAVRAGTLPLTPEVCDPIYATLEVIGELMRQVAEGHVIDPTPHEPLLATLAEFVEGNTGTAPVAVEAPATPPVASNPQPPSASPSKQAVTGTAAAPTSSQPAADRNPAQVVSHDADEPDTGYRSQADISGTSVRIATTTLDTLMNETGELITCTVRQQQRARDGHQLVELANRWRRIWRQVRPTYTKLQDRAPSIRPTVHYLSDYGEAPSAAPTIAADRETSVLLSALTEAHELIGELEKQLGQHVRALSEDSSQLEAVAERLHTQVRRTRMLPLSTLWSPLRLQVREMARAAGKQIVLDLDDGGAEADRQVLDRLRDVLLHLLRNAVDHGIEQPQQRAAAGKSEVGRLTLRADVGGDRLTLTLADDGAGLNLTAIQERALASGLINAADLGRLSASELTDLIFVPGFSTRTTVSALSGRGVGLDIVRAQIERMHGRVSVQSTPGAGCTFVMSVPLSLTSAQGLLLEADGALYAVPLDTVQRILAVSPDDVQVLEGRSALKLGERPAPLAHLGDVLGSSGRAAGQPVRRAGPALLLGVGDRQVVCLVDAVLGEQELVVQRLPAPLQQVRGLAGATILADGRVAPILDVVDVLRGVLGARSVIGEVVNPAMPQRRQRIVVVDDSITTRTLEKNILLAAGYDVHLASDGAEALTLLGQLFDSGGCDLLLSDVDMPHLNGFELTARVRGDSRLQHLPVVLVTSLDTPADRERGIAAGADAYLVKQGFDQHALLDTIASLL